MILGILSDSHGRLARTVRALNCLARAGATAFVHCGDIGTPEVLTQLVAREARFVWGNNDEPDLALVAYAKNLNAAPASIPLRLSFDGQAVAVFHGHERSFWKLVTAAEDNESNAVRAIIGDARLVLFGHTHYAEDRTLGGIRFVNPGALHRASLFTVATYDFESASLRFWSLPEERDELLAYSPPHSDG